MARTKHIGILTAGGDCPGLNAAIRSVGKAALGCGMDVTGFRDGFRGLAENRHFPLDEATLASILTVGGTILGTGCDKPQRMEISGETRDMTDVREYRGGDSAAARPRDEFQYCGGGRGRDVRQ